jgi:hypothetical protein
MNPDPEPLFALLDDQPRAPAAALASSQAPTPDPTPSDSIVGEPFFWASGCAGVCL